MNIDDLKNLAKYFQMRDTATVAETTAAGFSSLFTQADEPLQSFAAFFRPSHGTPTGGLCGAMSKGIAPVALRTGLLTRTVSPTRLAAGAKFKTLRKESIMTTSSITTPVVFIQNNTAITTSLDVAAFFGKRHDDVLRKIVNLESSDDFNARNFAAVEYRDAKGESRPAFEMTKDGFIFLVMGFTGAKAAQFKEAYIGKFNELEARHALHILNTPTKALPAPEIPVILSVPGEGRYFVHVDRDRRVTVEDVEGYHIVPTTEIRQLRQDFRTMQKALATLAERSLVLEGERHPKILAQPFEITLTVKPN